MIECYHLQSDKSRIIINSERRVTLMDEQYETITFELASKALDFYKEEADRLGISCHEMINMYLTDCAVNKRKLKMTWEQE